MKQNEEEKTAVQTEEVWKANSQLSDGLESLPYSSHPEGSTLGLTQTAMTCPNCGSSLEGRKCKLLCTRPGCGYMVTCSEW
jgi:hypothetical protein